MKKSPSLTSKRISSLNEEGKWRKAEQAGAKQSSKEQVKTKQTSEVSQAYKHDKVQEASNWSQVPSFLRQLSKRLKKTKSFLRKQSNSIMQRVKQIVLGFKP